MQSKKTFGMICLIGFFFMVSNTFASDWAHWRGPKHNGTSPETGLISSWSVDGENLIWRADFTGRSTPVVMNGRVYVNGRVGSGVDRQGVVACFDAKTGKQLWEDRYNLYLTTVPFSRELNGQTWRAIPKPAMFTRSVLAGFSPAITKMVKLSGSTR